MVTVFVNLIIPIPSYNIFNPEMCMCINLDSDLETPCVLLPRCIYNRKEKESKILQYDTL